MTRFPKVSEANRKREWSAESRAKISASTAGENNPFFGKKHSADTRKKLSENWRPRKINRLRKYGISDERYFSEIAEGNRWCGRCQSFFKPTSSKNNICPPCRRKYQAEWYKRNPDRHYYARHPEKNRKKANEYYHKLDPEVRRNRSRRQALKRKYGVTPEWYDAQLQKQNGGCAICSQHLPCGKYGEFMVVDHDHATGEPRGILCTGCNIGIGWIEKTEWLEKAHRYLLSELSY